MPLETSIVATVDSNISANINTNTSAVDVELSTNVYIPFEGNYVPLRLADAPGTTDVSVLNSAFRTATKLYGDNGTTGARVTVQNIKNMTTKVLYTENANDSAISDLDVGDFIFLKQ